MTAEIRGHFVLGQTSRPTAMAVTDAVNSQGFTDLTSWSNLCGKNSFCPVCWTAVRLQWAYTEKEEYSVRKFLRVLFAFAADAEYEVFQDEPVIAGFTESQLRNMDPDDRVAILENAHLDPYDYIYLAC